MSAHDHSTFHAPAAPESAGATASLVWSDARMLGFAPMDATHEEFYQVTFALLTCRSDNAARCLEAFEIHARQHFEQENAWMKTTEFPGSDCHLGEHTAVLESVSHVRDAFSTDQLELEAVHDLALQLFNWFPGHADFMDSALAAWLTQKSLGGRPVVLRRSLRR